MRVCNIYEVFVIPQTQAYICILSEVWWTECRQEIYCWRSRTWTNIKVACQRAPKWFPVYGKWRPIEWTISPYELEATVLMSWHASVGASVTACPHNTIEWIGLLPPNVHKIFITVAKKQLLWMTLTGKFKVIGHLKLIGTLLTDGVHKHFFTVNWFNKFGGKSAKLTRNKPFKSLRHAFPRVASGAYKGPQCQW